MSTIAKPAAGRFPAIADIAPAAASHFHRQKEAMLRRIVEHCKAYQGVDLKRSLGQTALSLFLYVATIAVIIFAAVEGYWFFVGLLAPLAAGFLVKLFIIQHDCGHGSYFENRWANHVLGFTISLLTLTPYGFWRDAHNRHHASSGDLSRRGVGAVDTLTVEEYQALSFFRRLSYRLYRHPAVMILFGAPFYFVILQRLPLAGPMPFAETYHGLRFSQVWKSVMTLNAGLIVFYGWLSLAFGVGVVAASFLPVLIISSWTGTWLFFVQHQYEDAYWAERPEWNYAEAAVFGSSHYRLPRPLRWITGNIGLHHIHHLASRIPNYKLMECYRASEDLLSLPVLTIRQSIKCARLALWDATQKKMVTFAAVKA